MWVWFASHVASWHIIIIIEQEQARLVDLVRAS